MSPDTTASQRCAAALSVAAGATALLAAGLRVSGSSASAEPWALAAIAFAALLGFALGLRGAPRAAVPRLLGPGLAAAAIALAGLVELPAEPTVESFGRSRWFTLVTAQLLAAGIALAGRIDRRSRAAPLDGCLVLFALLPAFDGALFLRDGEEFAALFGLFAAAALFQAAAAPLSRGPAAPLARTPFLAGFAALLLLALPAFATAVDRDRHLDGTVRLLAAGLPLFALALGPAVPQRLVAAFAAIGAAAGAGAVAAALAVLEAGSRFQFRHALGAELTLFGEHPNLVATFFAVAPPVALALVPRVRGRLPRALVVALAVLVLAALALTRSRAAVAAAALGVAAFLAFLGAIALWRSRPRPATIVVLAGGALLLAGGGIVAVRERAEQKLQDPAMQFRAYLWGVARSAIAERPLTGHGFLTSDPLRSHATPSDLDGRSKDTHPHCLALAHALGAGIPFALAFGALALALIARALLAAARLRSSADRALAAGIAASAVALLAAVAIDQGLAQHLPVPLFFGLLLGAASLLVRRARREPRAAAPAPGPRGVALAAGVLLAVASGQHLAAARLDERAARALQSQQLERADRASAWARRIDPWALQPGLRRAQVLDAANRPDAALAELRALAAEHPQSAAPAELASEIALDRSDYQAALQLLEQARARDPTGPAATALSLRAYRAQAQLGDRPAALAELARAARLDFTALLQLGWQRDAAGAWSIQEPGLGGSVLLSEVFALVREEFTAIAPTDAVAARRIATALAKTQVLFRAIEDAKRTIADYEALGHSPWVPLVALKAEIVRIEREEGGAATGEGPLPQSTAGDAAAVAGIAGSASIGLVEGRNLRRTGDLAAARAALEAGVDRIYDMVAEKQYLGELAVELFRTCGALRDLPAAERWLEAALYFNVAPGLRVDLLVESAAVQDAAGERGAALARLERAARACLDLHPRSDERPLDDLAKALAARAAAGDGAAVERIVAAQDGAAPGLLLAAHLALVVGDRAAAQRSLDALRRRFPEWLVEARRGP